MLFRLHNSPRNCCCGFDGGEVDRLVEPGPQSKKPRTE